MFSTTPTMRKRAFGADVSNADDGVMSPSSKMVATKGNGASTPKAFGNARMRTPMSAGTPMRTPMSANANAGATLTPRARELIAAQRELASPLRAAVSPAKPSSGVRSGVKKSDSPTRRDVARLRELNSMLLKQLTSARTAAAEAESARETLGDAVEAETRKARALSEEVEAKADALKAAAKRAKKEQNEAKDAKEEAERLRALNARLLKEVSIARNVVKARENDEQSLREAAGASAERAAALEAEIDVKQKTLDRVQLALESATARAADSLRANAKVDRLAEANAVLVGELATLRESAQSDSETLNAQIDAKTRALADAKADLAAAEAEVKSLAGAKADVDKLRTLNATLMQQIKSLRAKANESLDVSRNLEAKERELAKNQMDLKLAQEATEAAEEDVSKLRNLNVVLMQQISQLKQDDEAKEADVQAKTSELEAAQMALDLVEEELERSKGDVTKLRELNVVILAQIKTLKKASLDDRAAFKAELDAKNAQLSRAAAEVERLEQAVDASEGELERARANVNMLAGEVATLKQVAEDNMSTNAHLSGEIEAKKLELADAKDALAAAVAKASRLEASEYDVAKLRELNAVLIAQVKTLRTVETENENLSGVLRTRAAELEKAQLALASAERAKATGERVSEQEIANLRELNTRIIERMGQVKDEQSQKFQEIIDAKTLELSDVKSQFATANKELASSRKETAALDSSVQKLRVMNSELTGSMEALKVEMESEKKITNELREAVLNAEAESAHLRNLLQNKDEELESAWSALMCVNADLKHALHDATGMRALALKRHEELAEANVNVDRLRELNNMFIQRLHSAKKAALEAEALNAEFAAARTQAEVNIRQEEAKVAALEQTLKSKDEEYAATTKTLREEMEAGNNAAAQRLADVQMQMHAQINSLERQLEYANADLAKLRRDEAAFIEDQSRSAAEIESLVAQVEQTEAAAKKEAAAATKKIFALQSKITQQESANKALDKKISSSKAEITALKAKLESTSNNLKESCQELAIVSKSLQDARELNKTKDAKIETMRAELKELKNTAEHFTRLASENGDKVKTVELKLSQANGKVDSQRKHLAHIELAFNETKKVRDELKTKVSALERKGEVAQVALLAAEESLEKANQRCKALEHTLNSERAEAERLQLSLTESLNAAESSIEANAQLIAQLEARYQQTLEMLLVERELAEEERDSMQRELDFVGAELDETSANLEAMIERNNRGILVKIADSDMAKLVFGNSPAVGARGFKACVRLSMLAGILALGAQTLKEVKSKVASRR